MVAEYVPILLTVAVCIFARQLGDWLGVLDQPDSVRKLHADATPLVGGIAIMLAMGVWSVLGMVADTTHSTGLNLAILLCAGGVGILGFIDDQRMISPTGRLILLAIFSVVALRLAPELVVSRILTVGWGWVPIAPGLSLFLVVVALTGFSSAVNMVDGVNGLVLSLICVWSICLVLLGGTVTEPASLLLVASLITLLFNARGRLFLGDCGAFAISFTIGLLAIAAHNEGRVPLETVIVWFFLPVVDCLRLIPLRLMHRRSPFRPDRFHFHHRLGARIGDRAAIASYVGVVAATSITASLKPDLSLFCVCVDLIYYGGILTADLLSPPVGLAEDGEQRAPNVVALTSKQRLGS